MQINRLILGSLKTNCYILEIDEEVLIIDPADEYIKIKEFIGAKNIIGIIITHYHFDHIGALDDLNNYDVFDIYNLKEGQNQIGKFIFDVIYTKGHKDDAITIYFKDENVMFTGDFIFKDSIGRTDLAGGSMDDMIKSLNVIKKYPDDIIIYPGHGDESFLGFSKKCFSYYL